MNQEDTSKEYVYKQPLGDYLWELITGPLFPFLFRISPVLFLIWYCFLGPHSFRSEPPATADTVSSTRYVDYASLSPPPTYETIAITTFDYSSFSIPDSDAYPITFMTTPGPVYPGTRPTVKIKGRPYTTYDISVIYSSGASKAAGLEPKQSNAEGYVTWSWKVGTNTYSGSYPIVVTGDGQEAKIYFEILP